MQRSNSSLKNGINVWFLRKFGQMKSLGLLSFLSCVTWQGLRLPPLWSLTAEDAKLPKPGANISSLTEILPTSTGQLVNITTAPKVLYQLAVYTKESKFSFLTVVCGWKRLIVLTKTNFIQYYWNESMNSDL